MSYILSKLNCGNETGAILFVQMAFKHLYPLLPCFLPWAYLMACTQNCTFTGKVSDLSFSQFSCPTDGDNNYYFIGL